MNVVRIVPRFVNEMTMPARLAADVTVVLATWGHPMADRVADQVVTKVVIGMEIAVRWTVVRVDHTTAPAVINAPRRTLIAALKRIEVQGVIRDRKWVHRAADPVAADRNSAHNPVAPAVVARQSVITHVVPVAIIAPALTGWPAIGTGSTSGPVVAITISDLMHAAPVAIIVPALAGWPAIGTGSTSGLATAVTISDLMHVVTVEIIAPGLTGWLAVGTPNTSVPVVAITTSGLIHAAPVAAVLISRDMLESHIVNQASGRREGFRVGKITISLRIHEAPATIALP